jgi:hypothetical protein
MNLLGLNFTKISIERIKESAPPPGIKVDTNIDIPVIEKTSLENYPGDNDIILIKFTYILEYKPDFAKLEFRGNIILELEKPLSEDLFEQWKEQKIPKELRVAIFNLIFTKSNIKALTLEDQLNLPPHLPMPRLDNIKDQDADPGTNHNKEDQDNNDSDEDKDKDSE